MKNILVILFIVLWFSNYWLAAYFYPNYKIERLAWDGYMVLREMIFETMFFILLISSIFKPSRESRALIFATSVVVALSIVDKMSGVLTYAKSDIIVIAFAVFIGLFYYLIGYKWMKE